MTTTWGHLSMGGPPPAGDERVDDLATLEGARIEHIHSGRRDEPVEYLQDHEEWVVVLEGSAQLEVGGELFEMGSGDWAVLPAGVPHKVARVASGTRWLAVHGPPAS